VAGWNVVRLDGRADRRRAFKEACIVTGFGTTNSSP